MPIEMGIWRIDGGSPQRLAHGVLPSENDLETFLTHDSSLLGEKLLVIGRQVRTPHNKLIDLLAMDVEGDLHVLELKRDRTPREVVAQILDYATWTAELSHEDIRGITERYLGCPLEEAFDEHFGVPVPDDLNNELQLTIIATELDDSSERIVTYLQGFGVPINAVFFTYLEDEGRRYLARSWLTKQSRAEVAVPTRSTAKKAEWNGLDWFVTFGDGDHRSWEDAREHGFISAGGGEWYSRTLRALPTGARIFVHIPKHGYVAVGETLGPAEPFHQATVYVDGEWIPLRERPLRTSYTHGEDSETVEDDTEYIVPVRWLVARPKSEAYWTKGMFANQNSAGKLRQQFTLTRLTAEFDLGEGSEDS